MNETTTTATVTETPAVPEPAVTMESLQAARNEADYQSYLLLLDILPFIGVKPGKEDKARVSQLVKAANAIMRKRERSNNDLLTLATRKVA